MALNPAAAYGRDIACVRDADGQCSEVTGVDLVAQDALHRITNRTVLGDDGTGSLVIAGWGEDVTELLGTDPARLQAQQARYAVALQRDQRIQSAAVTFAPAQTSAGLYDVRVTIDCVTALGPFRRTISVRDLTAGDLAGQGT